MTDASLLPDLERVDPLMEVAGLFSQPNSNPSP